MILVLYLNGSECKFEFGIFYIGVFASGFYLMDDATLIDLSWAKI